MKYRKNHTSVGLKWLVIIFVILGFFVATKASKQKNQNIRMQTHNRIMRIKQQKYHLKHMNNKELQRVYDKTQPNIKNIESQEYNKLNKGVIIAYTKCETPKMYYKNNKDIKDLFGQQVGSKIDSIVMPNRNPAFRTSKSYAKSITSKYIAFGQYDSVNHTLPISIIVKYKTPRFNVYDDMPHKPYITSINGTSTMNLMYNLSNKQLSSSTMYNQLFNRYAD